MSLNLEFGIWTIVQNSKVWRGKEIVRRNEFDGGVWLHIYVCVCVNKKHLCATKREKRYE